MKICAIKKTYEKKTVLDVPSIELEKGKIYCVIGGNGSGKSTLARIISGVIPADATGSVVSGVAIRYVPQKGHAFRLKVRRNIMLGGADEKRADELIETLGLAELAAQNGHKLSGGETARVALARALMQPCGLLVLDEPSAAMDMRSTLAAEKLVVDYRDEHGCAVLWVTHSLSQAQRVADEIIFLDSGRMEASGDAESVLSRTDHPPLTQFLEFYKYS